MFHPKINSRNCSGIALENLSNFPRILVGNYLSRRILFWLSLEILPVQPPEIISGFLKDFFCRKSSRIPSGILPESSPEVPRRIRLSLACETLPGHHPRITPKYWRVPQRIFPVIISSMSVESISGILLGFFQKKKNPNSLNYSFNNSSITTAKHHQPWASLIDLCKPSE